MALSKQARVGAATLVAALGLAVGGAGLAGADGPGGSGGSPDGGAADRPTRGSTIVAVRGGTGNGFDVTHFNRTKDHLPTLSEAMAECGEYDTRVARVRCWSEVRTHYADLVELRRAINHQKSRHH